MHSDDPAIARVIELHESTAAATVTQDQEAFTRHMAPECMVNSPGNRVLPRAGVAKAFELGLIDYAEQSTSIEHASVRPNGEVLLMGSETIIPRGLTPDAGRTVTRRFTEIWRPDGDDWKLSVRQATICAVS